MKYAKEIIELMAPYPGRQFKMAHLVREATRGRELTAEQRGAARQSVLRAVNALILNGSVKKESIAVKSASYEWKSAT